MILKRCTKCKQSKATVDFVRNKNNHDSLSSWCKACHSESSRQYAAANPHKERERSRAYRRAHPEIMQAQGARRDNRRINLTARFRMTPEDYDALLAAQGGVCAICGEHRVERHRQNMHLDHDKVTGAIRGILCGNCNRGIGMLQHSPERLEAAAAYLRAVRTSAADR